MQDGNIKFITIEKGANTAPLETRAKDRIYVTLGDGDNLKCITFYDDDGKRYKQIDLDHQHTVNGRSSQPHVHLGYNHNENGDRLPNEEERALIDRVKKGWYNFLNQQ